MGKYASEDHDDPYQCKDKESAWYLYIVSILPYQMPKQDGKRMIRCYTKEVQGLLKLLSVRIILNSTSPQRSTPHERPQLRHPRQSPYCP